MKLNALNLTEYQGLHVISCNCTFFTEDGQFRGKCLSHELG